MATPPLTPTEENGKVANKEELAMLDFAIKWAPFGGGDEHILPEFGVLPAVFYRRLQTSPHPPCRHQRPRPTAIGRSVCDEIGNHCAATGIVLVGSQHALNSSYPRTAIRRHRCAWAPIPHASRSEVVG
jgi:hypothetical protein